MLERAEELKQRVRETPLSERLTDARRRIGKMCSEGRPPHMTIPVQYDDDDFYISTTLSDAQATIADLQGQLEVAQNKQTALEKSVRNLTEFYDKYNGAPCEQIRHQQEVELLQRRVAQLEGDVEEQKRNYLNACETIYKMYVAATGREGVAPKRGVVEDLADLQADHARVLGLVQALGVVGLPAEHTRPDDFILLKTGEGWMAHTYNYWAKFATEEEARAYIALLEYRASLPAQPAQGGA